MTHGSLFSGIGGFDLAAEWMGWTNVLNCEINEFCRKILKYHFPNAKQYSDIQTTDFTVWRGRVDVLTGGFPCQPFSLAGKRKGTEDDRYLWPEMLRAIRSIRPRWIVGENVYGLVNWSDGMVLEQVCADLEDEGYEVQPFVIPACAVGAPHRRDRVWIVAHSADTRFEDMPRRAESADAYRHAANPDGYRLGQRANKQESFAKRQGTADIGGDVQIGVTTNASGILLQGCAARPRDVQPRRSDNWTNSSFDRWREFPTESPVRSGNDGLSELLDGITVPAWCRESIKAYGNAVVPQLVKVIFEAI